MNRNRIHVLYLVLIAFFCSNYMGTAQVLHITNAMNFVDEPTDANSKEYIKCKNEDCAYELNQIIQNYAQHGYMLAQYKTVLNGDTINAAIEPGQRFYWKNVQYINVPPPIIQTFPEKMFIDQPFLQHRLDELYKAIIEQCENEGYPFASVGLQNLSTSRGKITADVKVDKGPKIFYGSITVNKGIKFNNKWLEKTLEIRKDLDFDQGNVSNIETRLNRLGIYFSDPLEIEFLDNKANITLNLEDQPVNSFDGVLGMFMNGKSQQAILAGYLNFSLGNLFSSWKHLEMSWKRLRPLAQELTMDYFHPVFFSRHLNMEAYFHLLKSDTSFMNVVGGLELQLQIRDYLVAFVSEDFERGSLLQNHLDNSISLGGNGDYKINYHGFGLKKRSGSFKFELKSGVGNKSILPNAILPQDYYKNIKLNSIQWKFQFLESYLYDIDEKWKLFQQLRSGILVGNSLLNNDAFRLGGLKSLRGYNEYYFTASKFLQSSIELRYYMEKSGYLLLFSDVAYLHNDIRDNSSTTTPLGIGTGISLNVGDKGHFDLFFAIDKESLRSFDLTNSKIHFGYLVNF